MLNPQRYLYTAADNRVGEASLRPYLPITLTCQARSVKASGLLDTGSMVNVLPYQVGVRLGAVWKEQTTVLNLTGNLARYEARALLVFAVKKESHEGLIEQTPLFFSKKQGGLC